MSGSMFVKSRENGATHERVEPTLVRFETAAKGPDHKGMKYLMNLYLITPHTTHL